LDIAFKEINSKYEECEYELEKSRDKSFKLERQLEDAFNKLSIIQKTKMTLDHNVNSSIESSNISISNFKSEKGTNITDKQVYIKLFISELLQSIRIKIRFKTWVKELRKFFHILEIFINFNLIDFIFSYSCNIRKFFHILVIFENFFIFL
jgi:hypothetical protein